MMVHVYVYPPRLGERLSRSEYGPAHCLTGALLNEQTYICSRLSRRLIRRFPAASLNDVNLLPAEDKGGNRHGD